MKYTCLILLWSLFATMALPADNLIQSISIVPCPESITPGTGYFTFSGKTDFTVENEEQAEVARCFSALFTQAAGFTPCVKVGEKKGKISFLTDDALKSEAYHLEITPRQIIVKASDTKGFFYALQTIRQLLPASIEGTAVVETADWSVPAMTIKDEPRFGYRGLMVDVARFFIPKENLLRIIDCMGMLKINTLHLHLVDDNGWRITERIDSRFITFTWPIPPIFLASNHGDSNAKIHNKSISKNIRNTGHIMTIDRLRETVECDARNPTTS
jgi:hexosaminidase